jgi:hypothetical protein
LAPREISCSLPSSKWPERPTAKLRIKAGRRSEDPTYPSVIDETSSEGLPIGRRVEGMPPDVRVVGYAIEIGALGQKHQLVQRLESILVAEFMVRMTDFDQ